MTPEEVLFDAHVVARALHLQRKTQERIAREVARRPALELVVEILSQDERIQSCKIDCMENLQFETNWIETIPIQGEQMLVGRFHATLYIEKGKVDVIWIEKSSPEHLRQKYVISGCFCFGNKKPVLEALLSVGEYLGTAYAILEYLAYVNPSDYKHVLEYYPHVSRPQLPTPEEKERLPWYKRKFLRASRL